MPKQGSMMAFMMELDTINKYGYEKSPLALFKNFRRELRENIVSQWSEGGIHNPTGFVVSKWKEIQDLQDYLGESITFMKFMGMGADVHDSNPHERGYLTLPIRDPTSPWFYVRVDNIYPRFETMPNIQTVTSTNIKPEDLYRQVAAGMRNGFPYDGQERFFAEHTGDDMGLLPVAYGYRFRADSKNPHFQITGKNCKEDGGKEKDRAPGQETVLQDVETRTGFCLAVHPAWFGTEYEGTILSADFHNSLER
jgi:hypothetical protein